MEGAFTLRAAILDSMGVTVGLLVVVITISEEEKLWSGSRIMALKMFSSQDVQLGDSEVMGMEASGSPETRAGGRRALSIDILRWLEKSVDQIS